MSIKDERFFLNSFVSGCIAKVDGDEDNRLYYERIKGSLAKEFMIGFLIPKFDAMANTLGDKFDLSNLNLKIWVHSSPKGVTYVTSDKQEGKVPFDEEDYNDFPYTLNEVISFAVNRIHLYIISGLLKITVVKIPDVSFDTYEFTLEPDNKKKE
ncbi:MAG: hypothetical protein FWF46_00025 [Oscillospiraceae bacterium]|nr:hypothetical protein [Oscillospiraceae bacterium]